MWFFEPYNAVCAEIEERKLQKEMKAKSKGKLKGKNLLFQAIY